MVQTDHMPMEPEPVCTLCGHFCATIQVPPAPPVSGCCRAQVSQGRLQEYFCFLISSEHGEGLFTLPVAGGCLSAVCAQHLPSLDRVRAAAPRFGLPLRLVRFHDRLDLPVERRHDRTPGPPCPLPMPHLYVLCREIHGTEVVPSSAAIGRPGEALGQKRPTFSPMIGADLAMIAVWWPAAEDLVRREGGTLHLALLRQREELGSWGLH